MKSRHENKLKDGAARFLDDGEEVLGAFVARPRGWTQAMAGSLHLGASQQGKAKAAAEAAELQLASPMALAVTQRRLLTFSISSPIGLGMGGDIKELLSGVPLADVDSIEIKRLALGKIVKLTVRGHEIKLETNAMAGAKELVAAYEDARVAA